MMNYMKSERYRLMRKKSLHITTVICLVLITAAAAVLYFSGQYESSFPYATSSFFYSNVIGNTALILIVALLFNLALTGKDMSLIKQSVSFGISRNTIFWSKLILRSEEHTSELQSRGHLVCRLLLEKKNEILCID